MNGRTHLAAWVSVETKRRFGAMAQRLGLTESALLKRMVELTLRGTRLADTAIPTPPAKVARDARLYVRLRPGDHLLLRERATARGMPAATYVSVLVRSHLRAIAPLADRELAELERAVGALGAIGRNLNHIARAALQGRSTSGASVDDLMSILRACEALRSHVKGLITANNRAWESDNAQPSR
jgi:DNA-binding Lrp family transcriptional regulator